MRLAVLVIGALLLSSGTVLAQDRGDVSGGYRYIRSDGVNFAKGWYFDVSGHVTDMFSVVGDVGGTYKTESETFAGITAEADLKVHTFMGGVRLRASMLTPRVVPFGQVLFGAGKASGSATVAGVTLFDESSTDPVLNLGGGVDVSGGGKVGVRVMAGYLRIFEEGEGSNAFSLSVGAKIGF